MSNEYLSHQPFVDLPEPDRRVMVGHDATVLLPVDAPESEIVTAVKRAEGEHRNGRDNPKRGDKWEWAEGRHATVTNVARRQPGGPPFNVGIVLDDGTERTLSAAGWVEWCTMCTRFGGVVGGA